MCVVPTPQVRNKVVGQGRGGGILQGGRKVNILYPL